MLRRELGDDAEVTGKLMGPDSYELRSSNVSWQSGRIEREDREARNGHRAACLWLTGLPSSGKSTIACALEAKLFTEGYQAMVLDGDNVRHGLCGDLGFSEKERRENIRRIGHTSKLIFEAGHVVICAFISPFMDDRAIVRKLFPADRFIEVYVRCSLEVCQDRDPKGLYKKALRGEIEQFTGISAPYEAPENPEIIVDTESMNVETAVAEIHRVIAPVVGYENRTNGTVTPRLR